MKCSLIRVTLKPENARNAASIRLCNEDDKGVTTPEEAAAYQGATFEENTSDCKDLHILYYSNMARINFINGEGLRVNYDYPIHSLNRIHTVAHNT